MITLTREEAQQVLDALEDVIDDAEEPHKTKNAFEFLRAKLSEPEPEPVAWRPIETAPKGKIILLHYKNLLGNGRTMRGRYYLPETLESDTTESEWADEGWYEESESYEYLMPLDGDPTHWMPLPPAPDTTPPQREWVGLTEEEIDESWPSPNGTNSVRMVARIIEAKLREKNG